MSACSYVSHGVLILHFVCLVLCILCMGSPLIFACVPIAAWSNPGLQFEIIIFFSGCTQMVVDQSYW